MGVVMNIFKFILCGLPVCLLGCANSAPVATELKIIPPTTVYQEPFSPPPNPLPVVTFATTEVTVVAATSTTEPVRDSAVIEQLVAAAEAARAAELAPTDFDCESWKPLLNKYGIEFDEVQHIMWRESRCSHALNDNPNTADLSYGVFQVNRYGALARSWDAIGFSEEYMSTVEGSVHAASVLMDGCGLGPWDREAGYPCYGQTPLRYIPLGD
jgi:hypothetical protein